MKNILAMDFDTRIFTTNVEEGWIEVIKKDEIGEKLNESGRKAICITATGWANISGYISPDQKNYVSKLTQIIPYSLHSNFQEIENFVKSISPSILSTVVNNDKKKGEKIYKIRTFTSYMVTLRHLKQQGYKYLNCRYTRPNLLSAEYRALMDFSRQQEIRDELGLNLTEAEKLEVNTREFEEKHSNVFAAKSKIRPGAKIKHIHEQDEKTRNDLEDIEKQLAELREKISYSRNSEPCNGNERDRVNVKSKSLGFIPNAENFQMNSLEEQTTPLGGETLAEKFLCEKTENHSNEKSDRKSVFPQIFRVEYEGTKRKLFEEEFQSSKRLKEVSKRKDFSSQKLSNSFAISDSQFFSEEKKSGFKSVISEKIPFNFESEINESEDWY